MYINKGQTFYKYYSEYRSVFLLIDNFADVDSWGNYKF